MDPHRRFLLNPAFEFIFNAIKRISFDFDYGWKKSHTKIIHSDLWKYSENWVGYYRAAFRASVELSFQIQGEVNSFECHRRLKSAQTSECESTNEEISGAKAKSFLLQFPIWKEFALPTASFFNVPCWALKAFIFCIFTKLLWSIFIASFHSTESPKLL